MMKRKWLTVGIILFFLEFCIVPSPAYITTDFDPLVDIEVTVEIVSIRVLDNTDLQGNPDFSVKILINMEEFLSPVWYDSPYLYDIHWTATADVPDDNEYVEITVVLYDKTMFGSTMKIQQYTANMTYSVKTGHWTGDDYIGDPSGYGRLNSCDNQRRYPFQRDYELWFNIYQTDYDGDGIPYWAEVYHYGTDPKYDNTGEDLDGDLLPIEWEHKWMYNPNVWDNHAQLDPDYDSLTNVEEYLVSSWGSDPYRRDVFIEMDVMAQGPLGQNSSVPPHSKELLRTVFNRQNIVFHLDDGCMGGGGDIIPFDIETDRQELRFIYNTYFLQNDSENWRRSVFRYAMIIYKHYSATGVAFVGEHQRLIWHTKGINTFVVSAESVHKTSQRLDKPLDFIFSCYILHETGHTFGIDFLFPPGCDNFMTLYPFSPGYWIFGNYKSVMNYRYTFSLLDYSYGSNGVFDYDDWGNLDFTFFEKRLPFFSMNR